LEGKTSHRAICFNKSKIHRFIQVASKKALLSGQQQGEGPRTLLFDKATGRYHNCAALASAVVTLDEKGESLRKGNEISVLKSCFVSFSWNQDLARTYLVLGFKFQPVKKAWYECPLPPGSCFCCFPFL